VEINVEIKIKRVNGLLSRMLWRKNLGEKKAVALPICAPLSGKWSDCPAKRSQNVASRKPVTPPTVHQFMAW